MNRTKTKAMPVTKNGQQVKHKLPEILTKRMQDERAAAEKEVAQLQDRLNTILNLLKTGFESTLDPQKTYALSSDLKYLIEQ